MKGRVVAHFTLSLANQETGDANLGLVAFINLRSYSALGVFPHLRLGDFVHNVRLQNLNLYPWGVVNSLFYRHELLTTQKCYFYRELKKGTR